MSKNYCHIQRRNCTLVSLCSGLQKLPNERRLSIVNMGAILELKSGKRKVLKFDDVDVTDTLALARILKLCIFLLGKFEYTLRNGHLLIAKEKIALEQIRQSDSEGEFFHYPTCCIEHYREKIIRNGGDNPLIDATFPEEGERICPLVKSVYHDGGLSMHHVCNQFCKDTLEKNEEMVNQVIKKFPHLI